MRAAVLAFAVMLLPGVSAASQRFDFDVYLDNKPIGNHAFTIQDIANEVRVKSEAKFKVKLLGITVFNYQHQAEEVWQRGCLTSLKSNTRENSETTKVVAQPNAQQLAVQVNDGKAEVLASPCVTAFSYWRPEWLMRDAPRLLNPQTGEWQAVEVQKTIASHPVLGEVKTLKLRGDKLEIDVYYNPQSKEWLGLKSMVEGNRVLEYRRPRKDQDHG